MQRSVPDGSRPGAALTDLTAHVREPLWVQEEAPGAPRSISRTEPPAGRRVALVPALSPERLGDPSFQAVHGTRYAYVAGAMANGIHSARLCVAMARSGMLGFFGAAGLPPARIEAAIDEIERNLAGTGLPWGSNLIHAPLEAGLEDAVVDLYLRRGVRRVSASAYMDLSPSVVRYAFRGIHVGPDGRVVRPNHVFAKISRPEVARHFLSPPPAAILDALVARGGLTREEAALAARLPVAEDITCEADSGGHTDNRPLTALFPRIAALRNELTRAHGYERAPRVGAAGGLGEPSAVAAAFALGAAYVLTGSVNQAAIESGQSDEVRRLLAEADIADVTMAPAADMFELGVKLQVLKRGTLFAQRAARLYELYTTCPSLEAIPADWRAKVEKTMFRRPLDEVWAETRSFWQSRDPREVAKAEADGRHKMALCFRWYLGLSSRWAISGDESRRLDYQVWCGPAMGAFNAWVKGSFLEAWERRSAAEIARNLLEGAAVITRAHQLRSFGVPVPPEAFSFAPRPLAEAAPTPEAAHV